MARHRFMWNNLLDSATLTASSASSTLPVTNLKNAQKTKVWRTGTSVAAEYVVIDLGSAQSVTCVILLNHNLTASDTLIALEGNSADSWGAPAFTQALTRRAGAISAFFASQSYRYWRVKFTKSAAGQTRDIGRIFLGTYDELTQNASPDGLTIGIVDLSDVSKSSGGQSYADIKDYYHEIDLSIKAMSHTQHEQIKTISASVGLHTPFFFAIDYDTEPEDWLYYVRFRRLQTFSANVVGSTFYWDANISLEEQL